MAYWLPIRRLFEPCSQYLSRCDAVIERTKARQREYQRAHANTANARIRELRASNPEFRERLNRYSLKYRRAHPDAVSASNAAQREKRRIARDFWRQHERRACEYVAWFSGGEDDFFDSLDARLGLHE